MKHTIIKYMGWSLNNKLIGADRDWRIGERHRAKMDYYLVDAEFEDTCQPRCKKCGWDIAYCEPHWETTGVDYHGRLKVRYTATLYHIHCYEKTNTEDYTKAVADYSSDNDYRGYIKTLLNSEESK